VNPRRFLGSAWAALHGPHDPRRLCIWALEKGFAGILPGPTPRPVDWAAVRSAAADLPFRFATALRLCPLSATGDRADRGLGSRNAGDREAAAKSIAAGLAQAAELGLARVLFEPGAVPLTGDDPPLDLARASPPWDAPRAEVLAARRRAGEARALDAACRTLHTLGKTFPDALFCLQPGRMIDSLGNPAALQLVFEDLPRLRLGYWHDVAIAACREARLGEPQGEWLERFGSRLAGITLGDWDNERLYAAPGSGLVDYPLVASYLGGVSDRIPQVLELDPSVPPNELSGVAAFLGKFGL
jgi:hypothetical protein